MRATPRRRSRGAVVVVMVGVLGLLAVLAGCSGDDSSVTDVTLPSSLSIPPDQATPAPETTTTTAPGVPTDPHTTPSPDAATREGAPVIRSLEAEPGAASCVGGTIPAVISFDVAPDPPVRVFSVFLDDAPAGASNDPGPITIAAVPCDGQVHQVLLIATGTGTDPLSSTSAVAFRSPSGS